MSRYMDYSVGTKPIQVVDLLVVKSKLRVKSLTILDVGHMPGRTVYRTKARFSKWAVCYITEGSGTYQVNDGEKLPVKKDSLFLVFPGADISFGPDPNGYWDEYFVTFEGPRIQEWINTWLFEPGVVRHVGGGDSPIGKIERIFMLMESGIPENADRAALLVESLLFELMMNEHAASKDGKKNEGIKLLADIADCLYEPFDARKLCERHHISLSTLKRTVSKYTGYPLHEYVHRLKISEAKNMLLNTERTVKEIASSLGYADVFYFSRLFKKMVGMAPTVYKTVK